MSALVKLGMIGTSWWADWLHLPSLASHPGAEIAAICGRTSDRAEAMAAKYGITLTYSDFRKMIAKADLDAIAIATPDDTHSEIAILALERGLHILCEKPLANSLREAEQMATLAERAGVTHMTLFTWRWAPVFQQLKICIDEGVIGRPLFARMSFIGGGSFRSGYSWRSDGTRSNGALGDLGSHMIDMTRWMLGDIATVSARIFTKFDRGGAEPSPANDTAAVDLATRDKADVSIFVSSAARLGEDRSRVEVLICGEAGSLEGTLVMFGPNAGSHLLLRQTPDHKNVVLMSERYTMGAEPPEFLDIYKSESAGPRAFIDAIIERRQSKPDLFDGFEAQRVIDAAMRSDEGGHRVAL